jgi:predicted CoA-binding protein
MMTDDQIREIYVKHRTIAVYGMSKDPEKPAHRVPVFLISKGYKIIPVNPTVDVILDRKCYPNLREVPDEIEIVDVFRSSDKALDVVKEAIARKKERGDIQVIWLQLGIRNDEAGTLAEAAGINFVQDRCMLREFKRLFQAQENGHSP